MTIVYTADVFCDECSVWVHGTTGPTPPTKTAVRKIAAKQKWLRSHGRDLCPKCAAQPNDTKGSET